jgi:hypothetical protein
MSEETDRQSRQLSGSYQDFISSLLSDREQLFMDVVEGVGLQRRLWYSLGTLVSLTAFYGLVAGAWAGPLQAISAGVKLPLLVLATLVICFPAFYVVQILVGSRLRLLQVLVLVLAALSLTAVLLAAFVPVAVFFLITGANYYFLQLLHVLVVLVAGLFGMYALHEGLSVVCEQRGVYPRKALTIMRAWAVLFAFVGIQMAWNLRPFLGDRGEPFQVFRDYEGNFYAAVVYSVNKLLKGEGQSGESSRENAPQPSVLEDLLQPPPDSGQDEPLR